MSTARKKLPREVRQAVKQYLETMLAHSDAAASKLRSAGDHGTPEFVLRNIVYWDNVRSGFRWALAQLRHY